MKLTTFKARVSVDLGGRHEACEMTGCRDPQRLVQLAAFLGHELSADDAARVVSEYEKAKAHIRMGRGKHRVGSVQTGIVFGDNFLISFHVETVMSR